MCHRRFLSQSASLYTIRKTECVRCERTSLKFRLSKKLLSLVFTRRDAQRKPVGKFSIEDSNRHSFPSVVNVCPCLFSVSFSFPRIRPIPPIFFGCLRGFWGGLRGVCARHVSPPYNSSSCPFFLDIFYWPLLCVAVVFCFVCFFFLHPGRLYLAEDVENGVAALTCQKRHLVRGLPLFSRLLGWFPRAALVSRTVRAPGKDSSLNRNRCFSTRRRLSCSCSPSR